ncbi:MAG TPA: stage II sporulation protein M [Armatimonadota bacterium]|nr:stage II sporulation protein M [Armatimonadota bacterium]
MNGLRGLSEDELLEFGRLYRRAVSALSHARAYGLDPRELEHLNWLVGRAYGLLYVTESSGWAGVRRFFRAELPQTLRRHGRLIMICACLFLAPAVVGALLAWLRPGTLELISPGLAAALDAIAERHQGARDWLPADFRPIASSLIMINNIKVSFLAFSTGILLGLGTIAVLLYNGFVLGVIGAGVTRTDAALQFWCFVAPHGVIELPSIVIAAAAGLMLGLAVVEPGDYTRLDALRLAGRQAGVMILGVVVFLVVAGLVEGLFSPAALPPAMKLAAAALLATGFWSYILLAGRGRQTARGERAA